MCTQSVIVVKLPSHLEKGSETHTYYLSCRVPQEPLFWLLSGWLAGWLHLPPASIYGILFYLIRICFLTLILSTFQLLPSITCSTLQLLDTFCCNIMQKSVYLFLLGWITVVHFHQADWWKLQNVAKQVLTTMKIDHICSTLASPLADCKISMFYFKIFLLTYKAVHDLFPSHLSKLITHKCCTLKMQAHL